METEVSGFHCGSERKFVAYNIFHKLRLIREKLLALKSPSPGYGLVHVEEIAMYVMHQFGVSLVPRSEERCNVSYLLVAVIVRSGSQGISPVVALHVGQVDDALANMFELAMPLDFPKASTLISLSADYLPVDLP